MEEALGLWGPLAHEHHLLTVRTPAQKALVVHLRRNLLWLLDELLAVTQVHLPPCLTLGPGQMPASSWSGQPQHRQATEARRGAQSLKCYEPSYVRLDVKYLPQLQDESIHRSNSGEDMEQTLLLRYVALYNHQLQQSAGQHYADAGHERVVPGAPGSFSQTTIRSFRMRHVAKSPERSSYRSSRQHRAQTLTRRLGPRGWALCYPVAARSMSMDATFASTSSRTSSTLASGRALGRVEFDSIFPRGTQFAPLTNVADYSLTMLRSGPRNRGTANATRSHHKTRCSSQR